MISDGQLEIIKKIQDLQESLISGMDNKLPEIFKDLSDQVITIATNMDFDPKNRAENLKNLRKLKARITDTITQNVEYQIAVKEVLTGFKDLKNLSDSYYSLLIDGYAAKTELYIEILNSNVALTQDLLLGAGIRSEFSNAISRVLKENIAGNSSRAELTKVLRNFITGTKEEKAYLNTYVKQTTNDAIMTFSREYNAVVSDDLNLNYFAYIGTLIDTSRKFCDARAGRYFKRQEVESWAKLGNWNGRIPGTTKTTIFSYAGGFGCRHELYALTKTQYIVAQKRGLNGIK